MAAVLGLTHPAIADLQHVRIIPVTGPGFAVQHYILLEDFQHRGVVVLDISGRAPGVRAHRWRARPLPGLVLAPFAYGIENRTAGLTQGLAHGRVALPGIELLVVAIVVLEIIHAPRREQ